MSELIMELRKINNDMEIKVCELFPTLRPDEFEDIVNYHNTQLVEWGSANEISVLKCKLSFRLGTGEVDEMCFQTTNETPGIFLTRCGVIRLLESINKQCKDFKLCDEWGKIKRSPEWMEVNSSSFLKTSEHPRRKDNNWIPINRRQHIRRYSTKSLSGEHDRSRNYHREHITTTRYANEANDNYEAYPRQQPRSGCYNCGEYNHRQASCRYDHRIRCNNCHAFGHKGRL